MIKTQGDIDRARKVLAKKEKMASFINSNLKRIEDFIAVTHAEANKLVDLIRTEESKAVAQSTELRRVLEREKQYLEEQVEKQLFQPQSALPQGTLLNYILFDGGQANLTDVFSGEITSGGIATSIRSQVHIPVVFSEAQKVWALKPHFSIPEEVKIAFHSPCRESERNEDIPISIGRHRLPITLISNFLCVNQLVITDFNKSFSCFGAWRRSKGDGNSFYRCFGVLYLEHLFRASTAEGESRHFYEQIVKQQGHFVLPSERVEDLQAIKTLCHVIKDLHTLKITGGNTLQDLQYHLQKPTIDKVMIVAMRTYTASYLSLHKEDLAISPFLENEVKLHNQILHYGEEAEGLALRLAARAFNIILYIQTVDSKSENVTVTKYTPPQSGYYHMLCLSGHYNCLIPQDVHAADQYNFEANTYSGQADERIIGCEQFFWDS